MEEGTDGGGDGKRLDALLSGYEDGDVSIRPALGATTLQAGVLTRIEVSGAMTRMSLSSQTVGFEGFETTLVLPALLSLKVTSHGYKLFQLGLRHSAGDIEEAWLTEAPGRWEGFVPSSPNNYKAP